MRYEPKKPIIKIGFFGFKATRRRSLLDLTRQGMISGAPTSFFREEIEVGEKIETLWDGETRRISPPSPIWVQERGGAGRGKPQGTVLLGVLPSRMPLQP